MPRNTREWALRKLSMVNGNLDTAGEHLQEVKEKYDEHHPEISGMCEQLQLILAQNIVFIDRLKEGM